MDGQLVKKKRTKRTCAVLIRNVPRSLREQAKSTAALRGDTLANVFSKLLRVYIKDPEVFGDYELEGK